MRKRDIDQKCDFCEYICDDRAQLMLHQGGTHGTRKTVYECYDCEYKLQGLIPSRNILIRKLIK